MKIESLGMWHMYSIYTGIKPKTRHISFHIPGFNLLKLGSHGFSHGNCSNHTETQSLLHLSQHSNNPTAHWLDLPFCAQALFQLQPCSSNLLWLDPSVKALLLPAQPDCSSWQFWWWSSTAAASCYWILAASSEATATGCDPSKKFTGIGVGWAEHPWPLHGCSLSSSASACTSTLLGENL